MSQKQQSSISSDISSNRIQEDIYFDALTIASNSNKTDIVSSKGESSKKENTTCNTIISLADTISNYSLSISNLNNNNRFSIEFQETQLHKEKGNIYISNSQSFSGTNSSTSLFKTIPRNYGDVSISIKQDNRVNTSNYKEVPSNNLFDIKSSNSDQDNTVFQEKKLFGTREKNIYSRSQEDLSTTSLIGSVSKTHQPIARGTGGNLYHRNIVSTSYFSSEEPSNQEPSNLTNYNLQAVTQLNKKLNNQSSNQSSNQTNKLIIDSISQKQIFLELSLLNKDRTHALSTVQIPVKIGRKEGRSDQQISIKLSIDNPKYKINKMLKKVKIIIVGAGASGIAAASKLLQEGINDFVVLEANSRIGGRINTVDFGK